MAGAGCPMRWTRAASSVPSATTTRTSPTLSGRGCGPTSGRWRAGSRRSRSPATTSSTRSATSRCCWYGWTRRPSRPTSTPAVTGPPSWPRAPAPSATGGSSAPSTAGGGTSTARTRSSSVHTRSTSSCWSRASSASARPASRPGGVAHGSTSTPRLHRCSRHSTPSPACSTRLAWPTCGCVWWKEAILAGQLEDGPGGVHGGLPRPPDPSPAHPRPS